jgi:hypothetical protein
MVHNCNPSTQEAEAGGPWVQGQQHSYLVSSKLTWPPGKNLASKKKKEKNYLNYLFLKGKKKRGEKRLHFHSITLFLLKRQPSTVLPPCWPCFCTNGHLRRDCFYYICITRVSIFLLNEFFNGANPLNCALSAVLNHSALRATFGAWSFPVHALTWGATIWLCVLSTRSTIDLCSVCRAERFRGAVRSAEPFAEWVALGSDPPASSFRGNDSCVVCGVRCPRGWIIEAWAFPSARPFEAWVALALIHWRSTIRGAEPLRRALSAVLNLPSD